MGQRLDIDQADVREGFGSVEVEQCFVNELAAQSPVPQRDVFQGDEPFQMHADLREDVLMPMAKALGVTVHELLGEPRPKGVVAQNGNGNA